MRTENTGKKCFVCGSENGFAKGKECVHCGADEHESAIVHLLVKYSGGEQAGISESTDQLKYRRILAIDASKILQDALVNCELFTSVSKEELKSITGARDGLGFERILALSDIDDKTAALINKLLAEDGIVIVKHAADLEKNFGNANVWQVNDQSYFVYHKKVDTQINFSGERFIPGIQDQKLETEHLQRYMSTRNLIRGLAVLDLACGEGYGSALLADTAKSVVGMDIDQETVDHANQKYRKTNLSFRQGDAANIPLEDHSVDAVVSFETIEHIDETLQNQFLQEIDRVLKQDGLLIMSTPNKAVYSDRYHYFNEFHIHEFYHDEFQKFLKRYFPYVHIYQQSFQVVSLLSSCNSQTKEAEWYGNSIDETEAKYYIAVASKKEINLPGVASLFVQQSGENEANIQRIVTLQNEETLRNLHIQELDSELEKRGKRIQTLQKEHAERDAHIRELDSELETQGKRIQILQKEHAERDAHIRELDNELEIRGKRIQTLQKEHAERDVHIKELDNELEIRGKRIQTLQDEQAKRDAHIKELDSELEIRGERIQALQEEQAERGAHIQRLDDELTEKGKLIRQLQKEEEIRNQHIQKQAEEIHTLTAERDHMEEQRNTLVKERDELKEYHKQLTKECEEQKQTIINKEAHIQLLLESDRELQRIHHSRSWKLLTKWWRFRDFLVPPNSKRRLLLKLVKKFLCNPIWCLKRVDIDHIRKFTAGIKSGSIASTSARLDNYLGGGTTNADKPDQFPLIEYACIEDVPRFHVPTSSHPTVSIVIPVYNQFAYTYACLKSIAKNSGNVAYEVIIADDCSTDLTAHLKKAVTGVKVVRNKKNLRFLLNCNNAAKEAKGKYILFLNNDTQVMENWLQPLITLIESKDDIGMVGSKLIYPDGRLQEAGGIVWKDASAWNYGHLGDPTKPEYNYVKEVDYISGAAIMIRSTLWKQLGGFDERFVPAYCEDTDLAFQVRAAGYKVVFQPKSVVIHFEGVSNGTDVNSGQKSYQVINGQKFYEKWKEILEKEHNPNGVNPFLARDRSIHKKTILIIDHYVPKFDQDAGSRTIFQYIKLFIQEGYNIKFIGDNYFPHQPYTDILEQMGVEVLYGVWYLKHRDEWLQENGKSIQYVWLNRPHIAVNYIDSLRKYTNVRLAYYGEDLIYLREMRRYNTTGAKDALESAEEWKKKEYEMMRKVDVCFFLSSIEIEEVKKEDPSIECKHISINIFDNLKKSEYKPSHRKGMVFVGGFTHDPNVDAVCFIHDEILPILKREIPDIQIHIVGSNTPQNIMDMNDDNIIVHGYLSDEELKNIYDSAKIAFIPLRYGAGVKGKVIEAMVNALPVVTTPIGAEGIEGAEGILQCADTAEDLAKLVIELYEDNHRLSALSEQGFNYVMNTFSSEAAKRELQDVFDFDIQ